MTPPPRPSSAVQLLLTLPPDVATLIDAIPSETMPNERRFLYKFFSSVWSGRGHVLEIGPFLGGTTRAIALGMAANPYADPASLVFTLDKFREYYNADQLRALLAPLLASGHLPADVIQPGAPFLPVFESLHTPHPYSRRIQASTYKLPDTRAELERDGQPALPDTGEVEAVFIDGCKSWFGTKLFMQEVAHRTAPGAFFIFQDYAWYTCFWLPSFLGIFEEKFELWGHVETTYVFRLRERLDATAIAHRFPDTPEELDLDFLLKVLHRRIQDAHLRQDAFGEARAEIQLAAALAYVGKKKRALHRLRLLADSPVAAGHEDVIAAARRQPTYRPDGPVLLPAR